MDLYSPFKRIIKDKFYHSIIVADTFHFTKIVMQALDELRLNLWRNTQGKEKKYFKYLKLSLAKDISKVKDKEADKLLYAFELSPVLKYAYYLKQQFLDIKKLNSFDEKEKAFRTWLDDAESSTIKEFKKPVKTLRQWHEYISNSFKLNLSNGPVEGKNNLIKVLKRISFGFRNLTNFKERIILCSL
jgi:transposase